MHDPKSTAALLQKKTPLRPALGMILGSGFQNALDKFKPERELDYGQIPGFPAIGMAGHAGKLVFGHFGMVPVVVLKGRFHYYEGYEMARVTFPVRVLAEMGVQTLLLTNAAGAVNRTFRPGDFMGLVDHINMMGVNPLRGTALPGQPRFVDLSRVYDPALLKLARQAAKVAGMRWREGVYLAVSGPSYETPAEIKAIRRLGADAVGMSTVPEAVVARQYGMRVTALSCLTNMAAGVIKSETLSHQEVLATGQKKQGEAGAFLDAFARLYENLQGNSAASVNSRLPKSSSQNRRR